MNLLFVIQNEVYLKHRHLFVFKPMKSFLLIMNGFQLHRGLQFSVCRLRFVVKVCAYAWSLVLSEKKVLSID